jgi:predicted phage terminase large subunit-like protein
MKEADLKKLCASDLAAFSRLIEKEYIVGKPQAKIITALEKIESGEIDRLIIQAPPRHGKSFTTSFLFPIWFLGNNPDKSVILSTYGQELSSDFGRKIKNVVDSDEKFNFVFPGIELATDSKSTRRFNTNKGGSLFAIGRGGSITGRGGDLIIIDDLIKNEAEARSPHIRKGLIEWYKQTLYTRLMKGGRIVVISTRWHEEDLIGFLLNDPDQKNEGWHVLDLPAINDKNEALWPEMFSLADLERKRRTLGSKNFASLYLNQPSPDEGSILKRNWFKYYRELPSQFDFKVYSWDMAFKGSDSSDYVVGSLYGRKGGDFYLIDRIRDRMDFPTTLSAVKSFQAKNGRANAILIEAKANGQAIIDSIRREISGVIDINPKDSKEARLAAVAPLYEAGNIYYPDPSIKSWIGDHVEEMITFPYGKNDDSVDAESQALNYMRGSSVAEWSKKFNNYSSNDSLINNMEW